MQLLAVLPAPPCLQIVSKPEGCVELMSIDSCRLHATMWLSRAQRGCCPSAAFVVHSSCVPDTELPSKSCHDPASHFDGLAAWDVSPCAGPGGQAGRPVPAGLLTGQHTWAPATTPHPARPSLPTCKRLRVRSHAVCGVRQRCSPSTARQYPSLVQHAGSVVHSLACDDQGQSLILHRTCPHVMPDRLQQAVSAAG